MKPSQKIFLTLILLLGIVLYAFRLFSVSQLNLPTEKAITLRGKVSQQPYLKGSYQIISLGSIKVYTDRFPSYFYGDFLMISGKFEKRVINPFQTEYWAFFPTIQPIVGERNLGFWSPFQRSLYFFRGRLEKAIAQVLPEPEASLETGILLGVKKEMPENFLNNLRNTGTLHIIVASGYNLSVVAGFLVSFLVLWVNRRKALILAFLGIIFYTMLVGSEAPVVRAAIMASFAYWGEYLGRPRSGLIGLLLAAYLMLFLSPLMLFDLGFQLSLMATGGILLIYPLLKEKRFFQLPVVGENLATTLAAQIGVTPLLLVNFGNLSWLSSLINALVLPLIPLLMNLGGIMVLFAFLSKQMAQVIAWFLWLPLTYFVKLVDFFGQWSFINLQINLSFWWAFGYYLVLVIIFLKAWRKRWDSTESRLF
jgi:competence protein ComEC